MKKKKQHFFLLLLLFSFTISCKGQDTSIETDLKACINEKVNNHNKESYGKEPFDFYEFIIKIENELIHEKLLNDNKKDEYLALLKKISKTEDPKYEKIRKKLIKISDEYGFGFNLFTINDAIFNQCIYKVSKDVKEEEKLIYKLGTIFYELTNKNYFDEELIEELFKNFNENIFKKDVYRAPIILLVMINLDNQYNPDLKKYQEKQKGKSFLGQEE